MYCSNCGNEMTADSRFCGECGTPVSGRSEGVAASSGVAISGAQSVIQHDYVVKGKELSKSYFQAYIHQLKAPFFEAQEMKEEKMTYGLISILLYSLFLSLTIYLAVNNASSGFIELSFFGMVGRLMFGWVLLFFLVTLVLFITFKIMRTKAGYGNLMNRLGALLSVPLLFSALAFVSGLIQIGFLSMLFNTVAMSASVLSIFAVIFSVKRDHEKAMDPFYGTVIAGIGTVIMTFIVFSILLGTVYNQLSGLLF